MSRQRYSPVRRELSIPRSESTGKLLLTSRLLLLLVLAIAPWTLGGVEPIVQLFLMGGVLASGVCWLLAWYVDPLTAPLQRLPLLTLPLVLLVVLGAIQLVPITAFSDAPPLGPELELSGIPLVNPGLTRDGISIYPLATRVALARMTIVMLAFFLASQLFASRHAQIWLWGMLTVSGMLLSFFGLAQKLSWNGRIFWTGPEIVDGHPFASFVNRNHAAGYLNLTLAGACGLLIWAVYRSKPNRWLEYRSLSYGLPQGWREHVSDWLGRVNRVTRGEVLAGTGVLLISAGVVASASRGGILALLCGLIGAIVWMYLRRMRRLATTLAVGMLAPALILISWLGMSEGVRERFAGLSAKSILADGRSQNWRDVWQGLPQVWKTGSGYGTYRYFHRPFQRHYSPGVYAHAENLYLETLVEGGVVALGLLCLAILAALVALIRLSTPRLLPQSDGVVCVGLVCLITQLTHAVVDFGLLLPANALTTAVLLGAIAGRAVRVLGGSRRGWLVSLPAVRPGIAIPTFAILLLANGAWAWLEIEREAVAERALAQARKFEHGDPTELKLQAGLEALRQATRLRPDDVNLHLHSAAARIRQFERRARVELAAAVAASPGVEPPPERQLQELASLSGLYSRIVSLESEGYRSRVEEIRGSPLIRETLLPAHRSLLAARRSCPWLPQVELYLAYLSVLTDDPPARRTHLLQLAYLASHDDEKLFYAGRMALQAREFDLAIAFWHQAFRLHHQQRYEILRLAEQVLPRSVIVSRIVPDDPTIIRQTLSQFGPILPTTPKVPAPLMAALLDKVHRAKANDFEEIGQNRDYHYLVGLRLALDSRWSDAQASLKQALAFDPTDWNAHSLLCEIYLASDQLDRAQEQWGVARELGMSVQVSNRLKRFFGAKKSSPGGNHEGIDTKTVE
jgi:tetratricopeptide (TPR) repeat protein/O-antigen ligase